MWASNYTVRFMRESSPIVCGCCLQGFPLLYHSMSATSSAHRSSCRCCSSSSHISRWRHRGSAGALTYSSLCSTAKAFTRRRRHIPQFGKVLTARVQRLISWFSLSGPFVVQMCLRWLSRKARHERRSSRCAPLDARLPSRSLSLATSGLRKR